MEIVTVIKTEADAWSALGRWTEGQTTELLEFSDWPRLRVKINGKGYDSSLKSGQMAALLDFKKIMGVASQQLRMVRTTQGDC